MAAAGARPTGPSMVVEVVDGWKGFLTDESDSGG